MNLKIYKAFNELNSKIKKLTNKLNNNLMDLHIIFEQIGGTNIKILEKKIERHSKEWEKFIPNEKEKLKDKVEHLKLRNILLNCQAIVTKK